GMYSKPYTPRQGILKKLDFYRGVLQKMMYGFLYVGMEAGASDWRSQARAWERVTGRNRGHK
ncbi:hypothetical protein, partial [Rhodohalobacter sulfatireducens]